MSDAITEVPPIEAKEIAKREKYIQSLRDFASWLELHPDVATPTCQVLYVWPTVDEMGKYAREMGKCRKSATDNYFDLTKDFLPAIQFQATWQRDQVCERVVVGQKEVTRDVVQVIGKKTVIEDVVEWRCPKVLEKNPQISPDPQNSLDKQLENAVDSPPF